MLYPHGHTWSCLNCLGYFIFISTYMISKYCFDLKTPVAHPLADCGVLNDCNIDESKIWYTSKDNVSKEFLEWIDQLGLILTQPICIFYTPKGGKCDIHTDGDGNTVDRVCMNWCVQGSNSLMYWFRLKKKQDTNFKTQLLLEQPYVAYERSQVVHLHTQAVKWPSVVQTAIPHEITNGSTEPRWVISCDLSLKQSPGDGLTMKQAKKIFKSWMY